jgi:predicted phosphodiesterase
VNLIDAAAEEFGKVFLPCVGGNHGRNTRKIWHKNRNQTSFDWMLYRFLAKHYEGDKRVQFYIPDGPDARFDIYHVKYLLTHGDKLGNGGDGIIGALGPILRGDQKRRARNAAIDQEYDVLMCGHFHQYTHMTRVIVNGSLKGYDEYAYTNGFGFELPQQALWLTHPKMGITYRMPVYCARLPEQPAKNWVSA